MEVIEGASAILSQAERRLEIAAQNISNVSTPGYRSRAAFSEFLAQAGAGAGAPAAGTVRLSVVTKFDAGTISETGNPLDLAIAGSGFFVVGSPEGPVYTRHGQFSRNEDGELVTAQGWPLQAEGGGSIVVSQADFEVSRDGVVTENGDVIARLAVVDFENLALLRPTQNGALLADEAVPDAVPAPLIRQGALEASNVDTSKEMVAVMEALRRAESGQRLITMYDDLMSRALSTFGQQ